MPKKIAGVWGIDIGQSAIKALRCRLEDGKIVADAFDIVEYPKILSQPEAEPEQLVKEALETFLSRNEVKGDKVAMSVPGQSGLTKFFKPPPVDAKKIPDIVRYEAKQQIPFPLEEVIWDFQQMAGGSIVDGFALDTEIGLFAMKREQVYKFLRPFDAADVEVDLIQLAPLSIYNFVSHDLMKDGPAPDEFDPDSPPESLIVLSIGADATDLIVTNGFRVWQRSIPLGGNHFTRQLTKELKLTFAKAEHLKRNARQAEDPKTVFQAMRPIFSDLVTEVQRSIGYFQGIDRKAKIRGVVLLGNTVKLPGLTQYLAKNLGYEVVNFEGFPDLTGETVVTAPTFKDNLHAFGVCYGLCLQGLGQGRLSTNLLPQEIASFRMVRAKKPWAVASVGVLLLACSFNFFFHYSTWSKVQEDLSVQQVSWQQAKQKIDSAQTTSTQHESTHSAKVAQLKFLDGIGKELVGNADRRLLWLELLKALNESLPTTQLPPDAASDLTKVPLSARRELYISYIESEYFPDLKTWFTEDVKRKYLELKRHIAARKAGTVPPPVPSDAPPADPAAAGATTPPAAAPPADPNLVDEQVPGPEGAGWVIEMQGYHYYSTGGAAVHVRDTLLRHLEEGTVLLTIDPGKPPVPFTMKELGITFPVLVVDEPPRKTQVPNPEFEGLSPSGPGMGPSGLGLGAGAEPGLDPGLSPMPGAFAAPGAKDEKDKEKSDVPPYFNVEKYVFTIQFCWQEKGLTERLAKRAEEAAAAAAAAGPTDPANPALPANAVPATDPNAAVPAGAVRAGAVPAGAVPAGAVPAGAVPAGAVPAGAVPAGAVPAGAVPAGAVPAGAVPAGAVPAGAVPAGAVPAGAVPAGAVPAGAVPAGAVPAVPAGPPPAAIPDDPGANPPVNPAAPGVNP